MKRFITHNKKPNYYTGIDWANPISKGLVGAWIMHEGAGTTVNDASGNLQGALSSIVSTSPWGVKKGENGLINLLAADERQIVITGYKGILGSNPRTFITKINRPVAPTITATNALIESYGTNSSGTKLHFRLADTAPAGALRVEHGGGSIIGTKVVTGREAICGYSYNGGALSNTNLYVDGQPDAISVDNGAVAINTASGDVYTLLAAVTAGRYFEGDMKFAFLWDRELSPSEHKSFEANPYQVLNPRAKYLPIAATAASGFQAAWANNATKVQSLQGMS